MERTRIRPVGSFTPINFGRIIAEHREKLGLTPYELSKKSYVDFKNLLRIESGQTKKPTIPTLLRLATILAGGEVTPPIVQHRSPTWQRLQAHIDSYMGTSPKIPTTFTAIGSAVGLNRERIRQYWSDLEARGPVPLIKAHHNVEEGKIEQFLNQGLGVSEIMSHLYIGEENVLRVSRRLAEQKRQQNIEKVKDLNGQGLGDKAIVETTGMDKGLVRRYLERLQKSGTARRFRDRASNAEIAERRKKVASLRYDPRNLTVEQIAGILQENPHVIGNDATFLLARGQILPRK